MSSAPSSRTSLAWASVRDSLWFVPTLAVVAGILLAILAVRIPAPRAANPFLAAWLFGGGAEGARGVLTAIAGSLITVTGTVFSVTIVALQLASSQFTPRLLRSFVADRVNQTVLGIFIGTFTYTLLVLRTIHSAAGDAETFVPQVAVSVALVLLLVSIGALIFFINHAAQSIRAPVILQRETRRTLAVVESLFPQQRAGRDRTTQDRATPPPSTPAGSAFIVEATEAGYLQAVHAEALWRIGRTRHGGTVTIHAELHIGAFAFPGKPLASVWPSHAVDDGIANAIRAAFVLGAERTPDQDLEFGIVELSDIAVKALSPGINDPTTALQCIDRLAQLLAALGTRISTPAWRESPDGTVQLLVKGTSFERATRLAFDQIRHYGAANPAIARKLLETIADLAHVVGCNAQPALETQGTALARAARKSMDDPVDLAAVERLLAEVIRPDTIHDEHDVAGAPS